MVRFKYADEVCVYPKLIAAVNALCAAKSKDCLCTSGYRSLEKQKIINAQVLAESKTYIQRTDGSVYNKAGQCLAAAYGRSNHCYCIAMDITDDWLQNLDNVELAKYGLVKPMSYEPWHVQLIVHNGISQTQKELIRDACVKGVREDMTVKDFQVLAGLQADGIAGPKTKGKAKEMLQICQSILGNDFKTPEDVIRATQNDPGLWLPRLEEIKYFPAFVMNIFNRLTGR